MQKNRPEDPTSQPNAHPEYTLTNEKSGVRILSIGVVHSTKPEDPQFSTERQTQIREFLSYADPDVSLTVIEFNEVLAEREWVEASTLEEVIRKFGEAGFTAKLSWEKGVEVCCLEPNQQEQIRHVLSQHQIEDVLLRFVVLYGLNYTSKRNSTTESFEEYISRRFAEIQDFLHPDEYIQLESLKSLWVEQTQLSFTFEGLSEFRNTLFERDGEAKIVQIDKDVLIYRDSKVLQGIQTKLNSGIKTILLVQGRGHTIRQRHTLEEIIGASL